MLINVDLGNLIIMLVIGIAGAFIGGWLLPTIGLRPWGVVGNFVTATVGALLLLFIVRLLSNRASV